MTIDRRAFLAASAAAAAIPARLLAEGAVLRPEAFGAKGDGVTNDTRAFAALGEQVNRRGGGTIMLAAGRTYVVGSQQRGGGSYGWNPSPILELHALSAPLHIIGNGARLRADAGLRFGTFDLATGEPAHRHMPNYRVAELASPYRAMISVEGCTAPVDIRNVELDGNVKQLLIGGTFGDTGWQVPGDGILLRGNRSTETLSNVLSHHHGRDGVMVIGDPDRTARSRFSHYRGRYNGRQGLSLTAGRGYDFADCEFSHTGRAGLVSAPAAGIDIEAEDHPIRDLSFIRCKFIDNAGVGMLADSGDSGGAHFTDCLFVGTTTWAAWPNKPHFEFDNCTFVGSIVHPFADPSPSRATHFTGCRFSDDRKLSPTGQVYTGGGPIANLAISDNVLFDRCRFELVGAAVLPWSWRATYKDCVMSQRSPKTAMTKGRYLGRTTIDAPVDLYGSMVEGELMLNGRLVPRGANGGAPW